MKTLLSVLFIVFFAGCTPAQQAQVSIEGRTMGTTYHIKWVAEPDSPAQSVLHAEIDAALVQVNKEMSTYDPTSELSVFNQRPAFEPMQVSDGTATVIREAIRLGELTGGVLDVTVGPLVNLWGFGPNAKPEKVPSDELIAETKARTGLQFLQLDDHTLTKLHDDLYVDLSTIAKGWGVDVVAEILASHNIHNYLVEIGGEMRLAGRKADGSEWRVAVEKPVTAERAVQEIISVGDNGIATSGDYRNYFEEDGLRYSHLIDPTTGKPIQHNLVSVTVVHPSCMTADGLATALMVMGFDRALEFAAQQDLAVLLIKRENGEFHAYNSPRFEPYLRKPGS
ncbi:FAD:protein FMN transferase [Bowmanella sp. JS7-9]|uniref:FAD:protein FMN transferase n=1 Tax=Pseudobowmanella zhangzhouensis TaxID=1537679 RepID=A0ABW1XMP9_9ALTE|nr:FAD:protein FMN transferase [Bowmanella sp. JS7-9]